MKQATRVTQTPLIADRYEFQRKLPNNDFECLDVHLGRSIHIRWLLPGAERTAIQKRLARLQDVRSPYLAMIYDLVLYERRLGIVEEALTEPVLFTSATGPRLMYQFCAGLASLHEAGIAHGNLRPEIFCKGPLGEGRLGKLLFTNNPPSIQSEQPDLKRTLDQLFRQLGAHSNFSTPQLSGGALHASALRDVLKRMLLKDRHRALIQRSGIDMELNAENRLASIRHSKPEIARFEIEYDGTRFFFRTVVGEVAVNGKAVQAGDELPVSCVIRLGDRHRPLGEQHNLTFDQSHPEVI